MRALRLLAVAAGLIVATGNSTAAQQRLAVLSEAGTPVVATELLLTVGPIDEGDALAGIAYLSARSVIAPLMPMLDSLGARVTISPQKDAISFSVIAAPDAWEEATGAVIAALFGDSPDTRAVQRERLAIAEELRGRTVIRPMRRPSRPTRRSTASATRGVVRRSGRRARSNAFW